MATTCPVCMKELSSSDTVCPQCGFRLQGLTQEFRPVDLSDGDASTSKEAHLRVIKGPQIGVTYTLNPKTTEIGRNPNCDIFLNDMTVSRMHATVNENAGTYVINDAQSYNGVWVNNKSIDSKVLKPGDHVQIGKFAFVFEEE